MATVSRVVIDKTKLDALRGSLPQKAINFIDALAFEGEGYVKRSFTVSPSSPGEAPGVDTGALRASIHVETLSRFRRAIVAGTDYAIHLEFGTSRMGARPFMSPMVIHVQRNVSKFWGMFVG